MQETALRAAAFVQRSGTHLLPRGGQPPGARQLLPPGAAAWRRQDPTDGRADALCEAVAQWHAASTAHIHHVHARMLHSTPRHHEASRGALGRRRLELGAEFPAPLL